MARRPWRGVLVCMQGGAADSHGGVGDGAGPGPRKDHPCAAAVPGGPAAGTMPPPQPGRLRSAPPGCRSSLASGGRRLLGRRPGATCSAPGGGLPAPRPVYAVPERPACNGVAPAGAYRGGVSVHAARPGKGGERGKKRRGMAQNARTGLAGRRVVVERRRVRAQPAAGPNRPFFAARYRTPASRPRRSLPRWRS